MYSGERVLSDKLSQSKRFFFWLFILAIFLPRLIVPDDFFIQDEQLWMKRSQIYVNALARGDIAGAVQYSLSNHPAITLMTVIGPVANFYGTTHDVDGLYDGWSLDDKRESAVWARWVWGLVCSFLLLALYGVTKRLRLFTDAPWQAALVIALLGLEPWVWGISRSLVADAAMALGLVGSLVTAVLAREQLQMRWVVLSGIWWGLAFVSKSPALIVLPIVFLLAVVTHKDLRLLITRAIVWITGAYAAIIVLWPPFVFDPWARLADMFGRIEYHSAVQEIYDWPGFHPPLFVFTLSAFATVGCLLYLFNRIQDIRKAGWRFFPLDIVLAAGIWHGLVLLYLHGDHARKNLPVLALLGFMGAVGWVWWLARRQAPKWLVILGLIVLQGVFVWPYFPHVISSYNVLFPSVGGKRLLVDVGNSSRLAADYINRHSNQEVWATGMDSLISPYLDGDNRKNLRALPAGGELRNLDPTVTHIIMPASLPARVHFDPDGKRLLEELSRRAPEAVLSIRDVPMFYVYKR